MSILEKVTGKIAETFKEKYINPQVAEIKSNFEENRIEKEFKVVFRQLFKGGHAELFFKRIWK